VIRRAFFLAVLAALVSPAVSDATTFRVNWNDRKSLLYGSMTFHVSRIVVGRTSWQVFASFRNRSALPLTVGAPRSRGCWAESVGFGICFPRAAPSQRAGIGAVFANVFKPRVPRLIRPHHGWSGSFAGTGRLPRHIELSVGFGTFKQSGSPPFGWITSRSFRL
jgi:hypothetical protein